jgi:hypothetical protein
MYWPGITLLLAKLETIVANSLSIFIKSTAKYWVLFVLSPLLSSFSPIGSSEWIGRMEIFPGVFRVEDIVQECPYSKKYGTINSTPKMQECCILAVPAAASNTISRGLTMGKSGTRSGIWESFFSKTMPRTPVKQNRRPWMRADKMSAMTPAAICFFRKKLLATGKSTEQTAYSQDKKITKALSITGEAFEKSIKCRIERYVTILMYWKRCHEKDIDLLRGEICRYCRLQKGIQIFA